MQVKYDQTIDTKYITIKDGEICATKNLNDWLILDLNLNNEVIGVEVLDASKNPVDVFTDGTNLTWLSFSKNHSDFKDVPRFSNENSLERLLTYV